MQRTFWLRALVIIYFTAVAVGAAWAAPGRSAVAVDPRLILENLSSPSFPGFIESVTPQPNTVVGREGHISIQFRYPLVPLGRIDQAESLEVLKYFSVMPEIAGTFRLANPNLVVFEPTQGLPQASRLQVVIKQGLRDLEGHEIDHDFRWSFDVDPLHMQVYAQTSSLNPYISINASAPLRLAELKKALTVEAYDDSPVPPLRLSIIDPVRPAIDPASMPNSPLKAFGWFRVNPPPQEGRSFRIEFQAPLKKATRYSVRIRHDLLPAQTNLPLAAIVIQDFSTYYPLTATLGKSYSRVFDQKIPAVSFNNALTEGAEQFVEVDPKPEARKFIFAQGDTLRLDDRYLKARTLYKVTLKQGLKDVFDQTLEEPVTLDLLTPDYRSGLWAPEGITVVQPSLAQKLTVHYVNVPSVRYAWRALTIKDLQRLAVYDYLDTSQLRNLLPAETSWNTLPASADNQRAQHDYALPELLKSDSGALVYGFSAELDPDPRDNYDYRESQRIGMLVRTDLGVYSQWLPEEGTVQVYRLSDGAPQANAAVNIYTVSGKTPCASGVTDAAGGVHWESTMLAQCFAETGVETRFAAAPRFVIEVRHEADWTFSFSHINTRDYYGDYYEGEYYDDGAPAAPRAPNYAQRNWSGATDARGILFSDRFMYKPGERVTFTGMVRTMRDGKLFTPKGRAYTLQWTDPDGNKQSLGAIHTNFYGSFSLTIPVPSDAKLGFYQIEARASDLSYTLNGALRVAEFRAPPFKVQAQVAQDKVLSGKDINVTIAADYLHGAPLNGGKVTVNVTRRAFRPSFSDYEEFNFGKPYIYRELEKTPVFQEIVMQQALSLDAQGKGGVKIGIDALPFPARYGIDAEVSDSTNASLTGKTTFTAYPHEHLIGIKMQDYVIGAGQPVTADIVVLDLDGKPVSGVPINIRLKHIDWTSAYRVLRNGLELEQNSILQTAGEQTIISDVQPVTVSLSAKQGGHYVIEANFSVDNPATLSAAEAFVVGSGEASWYQGSDDSLSLKLNKTAYQVGDTATVLVQSPYPEAEALITVLRDRTYHRERQIVKGTSALFSFKITEGMLPNAQVQVMLTRRGDIKSAKHLVRLGAAAFSVNHQQLALKIELTPELATLEPTQTQTIKIKLRDTAQQPVVGQVSVIVANEAILQLNNHRPPNLLDTFYCPFPLLYVISDNRNYVQLLPNFKPFDKGWGFGGGFASALASNVLRKNFRPLPFYYLDVITDAQGEAEVSFTMPDDLTTWRVMAIAADDTQRFGNADTTFRTSKALLAEPALPRFARVHDRFDAGLQIINTTGKSDVVTVEGEVTPPLRFVTETGVSNTVRLRVPVSDKPLTQRVPMTANAVGVGTIRFQISGEGALQGFRDGFQASLQTALHQPEETTVQVGSSTAALTSIPLNLREGVADNIGGLTVQAASSLMPNVVEPLDYMIRYPYGCVEQTTTRILARANMLWLAEHYDFPIDKGKIHNDLRGAYRHLLTMRTASGGFSFWPGERNATFPPLSAYAARGLAALEDNGVAIDAAVKKSLTEYLERELNGAYIDGRSESLRLDMLEGLEALGVTRDDYLQAIFAQREKLSQIVRLKLAARLIKRSNWNNAAAKIMGELRNQMVFDARTAQVAGNAGNDIWYWLGDPQVQQALALKAFALYYDADTTLVDRLLRGLLDARKNGLWNNTYSNSQALDALVAFARAREAETPSYTLEVKLADRVLLNEVFDRFKQTEIFTPMAELPGGKSELQFTKDGTGTLHYLASYRYSPLGPAPGRDSGIHVERTLFALDQDKPLATWTENAPAETLQLRAGQTYKIKLKIDIKQWSSHVAISDFLPAGLEAVDSRLATSNSRLQTDDDWRFSYKETGDQRVDAFIDEAYPQSYELDYFARAITPGKFTWPGGEATLMYTPETFGRTAGGVVEIR